jgi:hypothetical protein
MKKSEAALLRERFVAAYAGDAAEAKAKEEAEVEAGKKYRLGKDDELGPADLALFDFWDQPAGEGGLEEVLRKSAEPKKIAIADRKAKMSKCPPIEKTEEAEPAAEPPEKPGEMLKTASAVPKLETAKCPPIEKTEEAEPAARPAARQPKPPGIF